MIILYIIIGLPVVFGIIAFILSNRSSPKDRAAEAAGAAAGGAMMGLGCVFYMVWAAIPIAIAILIVLWVLKGCSG